MNAQAKAKHHRTSSRRHVTLRKYLESPASRATLAAKLGVNAQYLYQLATGWQGRRPSVEMAMLIEKATGGVVTRASMRPDVWG